MILAYPVRPERASLHSGRRPSRRHVSRQVRRPRAGPAVPRTDREIPRTHGRATGAQHVVQRPGTAGGHARRCAAERLRELISMPSFWEIALSDERDDGLSPGLPGVVRSATRQRARAPRREPLRAGARPLWLAARTGFWQPRPRRLLPLLHRAIDASIVTSEPAKGRPSI